MSRPYHGKYIRILSFKRKRQTSDKIWSLFLSILIPVSFICFLLKLKYNDDNDGLSRQKVGGG